MEQSNYPIHEKVTQLEKKNITISQFLDFLTEQKIRLAKPHKHDDSCYYKELPVCNCSDGELEPIMMNNDNLIAMFFDVSLKDFYSEKETMIHEIRNNS